MTPIDHVVVLMLENRSFDHVFGWLKSEKPLLDGLTGQESNPTDTRSPLPSRIRVSNQADWNDTLPFDPPHEFPDVTEHIFGTPAPLVGQMPSMDGFFQRAARRTEGNSTHDEIGVVMSGYAPGRLPAIHALAREFAVCDRWFSSVPGPTWPNRFFAHCASAGGFLDGKLRAYDMPTVFNRLNDAGKSFRIYFHDVPQALVLSHLALSTFSGHFQFFGSFLGDAAKGALPTYSFIEPNYSDVKLGTASDQHPPSPMRAGDELVRTVYEALRASPKWERTLLVVTWDEHGGFFDHVPPPPAVPPGNLPGQFGFRFDRLGVRVPAIVVSPHIARGTIDSTIYEHASIPATLSALFGLAPLTERDRHAATFHRLLTLNQPRDTPLTLPRVPTALPDLSDEEDIPAVGANLQSAAGKRSGASQKQTKKATRPGTKQKEQGLTNLQRSLVTFVESLKVAAIAGEGKKKTTRVRTARGQESARLHAAVTKMATFMEDTVRRGQLPAAEREAKEPAAVAARVRNVIPDAVDLRDRKYMPRVNVAPPLALLPPKASYPPFDQGSTHACTGYALAGIIDELLVRAGRADDAPPRAKGNKVRKVAKAVKNRVSPRMLYSMARRYDEFPGATEDTGSSVRGALKGWFRNGACRLDLWDETVPVNDMPPAAADPTLDWWRDAMLRPLGAYYRVDADSVADLQMAIDEVGAVLVSAFVHAGWQGLAPSAVASPKKRRGSAPTVIPDIPFLATNPIEGGHAFVLVGYDDRGFFVRNSWGDTWGAEGVARLTYGDWRAHKMDAWVVQLGVPTAERAEAAGRDSLELTESEGKLRVEIACDPIVSEQEIGPFIIDADDRGRLSGSGRFRTQPGDIQFLLEHHLPTFQKRHGLMPGEPFDVVIYAHGGLVDEDAAAATARRWIPELYAAKRFPIFLMWETGAVDIAKDIVKDAFGAGGPVAASKVTEWMDRRLEGIAAPLGTPLWSKMKSNAASLIQDAAGALRYLFEPLSTSAHFAPGGPARLHLIGHSAGSIVHSELAAWLIGRGFTIERMTFLAPAVRVDRFEQLVLPHLGAEVRHFDQYMLTDAAERSDPTVPLYGKSLLYLVSRAFEGGGNVPILGMDVHLPNELRHAPPTSQVRLFFAPGKESQARTHGGFDDDAVTRKSILDEPLAKVAARSDARSPKVAARSDARSPKAARSDARSPKVAARSQARSPKVTPPTLAARTAARKPPRKSGARRP